MVQLVLRLSSRAALAERLRWPVGVAAVLALAALLVLPRLGDRSLWSEEVRWAEIPRAMAREGTYFWPTFNGRTYYDKPLGSYWLVLAANGFQSDIDERAARLPGAISALVGVLVLMLLTRRLYGDGPALLAGVIMATSFSFVFFARHASSDVENLTGVLVALWLFHKGLDRPGGRWTLLFWLAMALTSLTKGLLGFALPLLIAGVYATLFGPDPTTPGSWVRRLTARNRWLLNRTTLVALPLALGVYFAPFLVSGWLRGSADGLEMVYRENVRRFFDPVNHRGPVYLYAEWVWLLLAPWSLLLPAALVGAWRRREDRFALVYFVATFAFFTLSSSRRSYYLLPILPAGAMLVASLCTHPAEELGRVTRWLLRLGCIALALGVIAGAAALLPPAWRPGPLQQYPELPAPAVFVAVWVASAGAIAFALLRPDPRRVALGVGVLAFGLHLYLFVFALPAAEEYRTQKPFVASVHTSLGRDLPAGVALYRTQEVAYYLDQPRPLPELHTPDALREAMSRGEVSWVILRRRDWPLPDCPGEVVVAETVHPWEPADQVKGKLLLVRLGAASLADPR